MGLYVQLLGYLGYINMFSWLIASIAAYKFKTHFKKQSWTYIMVGSLIVLLRQIIKLIPAYKANDLVYISRYLVGAVGAIFLFIGFLKLYQEVKA